jgi:F-type H+-transporting ATPase subunit delta
MADKRTVARPYAKAAFNVAQAEKKLDAWSQALATAAVVVRDERVESLLSNPNVARSALGDLVAGIAADGLGDEGRNFFATLAENRRLDVLPQIAMRFDEMKDDAERVISVELTSVVAPDEAQRAHLVAALERRLQRKVELTCKIDPELIGGAVVRAGDLVIDGSLRSQLERIRSAVSA